MEEEEISVYISTDITLNLRKLTLSWDMSAGLGQ